MSSTKTSTQASPVVALEERRIARLHEFADAWNRHDVDGLMRCMADDCVYESSVGRRPWGDRHVGRRAVREAFTAFLERHPDARWEQPGHHLAADLGITTWTFIATEPDGRVGRAEGCDLLTFVEGSDLIKRKSALRKGVSDA